MATRKIFDLAVKTGSFVDREGNTKGRYVNAGAIWEKDDGSRFISINRTFNPAGVPNPENKDSILLSQFEIREPNSTGGGQGGQSRAPAPAPRVPAPTPRAAAPAPGGSGYESMDDDIPF